jgi:nicotinamidase-related amidase
MATKLVSYVKANGEEFLNFLDEWYQDLPIVSLKSLLKDFPASQTALISIDVINGFCKSGNLYSPRIGGIIHSVVELFRSARQNGMEQFVLLQDTHPAESKEFQIYPEHCVEGSVESQTIQELSDLENSNRFVVIPKRTIHPGIEPKFQDWLEAHDSLRQFILVGDCTDICVYQTAVFLKSWFVQKNEECHVIVPASCVDTFDIPVDREKRGDALPHPGEFLHVLFLYHMITNGIHVVGQIK